MAITHYGDFVAESTTDSGTGKLALDGALGIDTNTFKEYFGEGPSNSFDYHIRSLSNDKKEAGEGWIESGTSNLVRNSVSYSTNNDNKEDFNGGTTKKIHNDIRADKTQHLGINDSPEFAGLDITGAATFSGTVTVADTIKPNKVVSSGAISGTTVNTGQGANELYAMDQDVQTSDSPAFAGLDITGSSTFSGTVTVDDTVNVNKLVSSGAISGTTVNTGQGANELYAMDQDVQTSDSPTFSGLDITGTSTFSGTVTINDTVKPNKVVSSGAISGTGVNTGQGLNELYAMDQDVQTSDSPSFSGLTVTGNTDVTGTLTVSGTTTIDDTLNINKLVSSGAISGTTVNTGQGANELYAMDQDVQTTDSPTFGGATFNGAISVSGTLDMLSHEINNVSDPTSNQDAATKSYVDYDVKEVFSNYTTSGEDVILVDTTSGTITVTLSTADLSEGHEVVVTDSGQNASNNNITINTEGAEQIDGGSSISISTNDGAQRFASNGSNWFTSGGGGGAGIHASQHLQGANDALEASLLSGASGTNEQILVNQNGSGIAWQDSEEGTSSHASTHIGDSSSDPIQLDNYLDPDGLTIANSSTDADHDVDITGGKVWLNGFGVSGRIVTAPDAPSGIQIDTTGAGGRINSSSLATGTWYEIGIIGDSSGSNPVDYGIYQDADRPTASSDLPTGYDLFRAMGTPGKTWWVKTDGSSNILGFDHNSDGSYIWSSSALSTFSINIFSVSSPSTTSHTIDISEQSPPTKTNVYSSLLRLSTTSNGAATAGLHNEAMSNSSDSQTIASEDDASDRIDVPALVKGITGQTVHLELSSTASVSNVTLRRITQFKAVN